MSASRRALHLQYANPAAYPPVLHGMRLLAQDGWNVLVLGAAVTGTEGMTWPRTDGVIFKRMRGTPRGLLLKLHYLAYAAWALYWCARWRPSLIYASDAMATPVALFAGAMSRAALVYHEHDSPTGRSTLARRALERFRALAARRAILCVLPNADRADAFVAATGADARKVRCVWNCPSRTEARGRESQPARRDFVLYFHGSLNESRLPTTVLDALVLLPPNVRLEFAGYETLGSRGYVRDFLEHARLAGLDESRVTYLGMRDRPGVMELARTCDAGLALVPLASGDINMRFMVGASNKPFDYMACGLALVVSRLREWQETFVKPGYAVDCDPADSGSIAAAIQALAEDPSRRREIARAAVERVRGDWNYERQFAPVLEAVRVAAEAPRAA